MALIPGARLGPYEIVSRAGSGGMPVEDSYIAATARRHGLTIATANDRDFKRPGLKVFNPFKELQ